MEPLTHLDEVTTRVLAPNPSLMTLEGTNTYLLGASGVGEVVCVDPGPDDPAHRAAIEAAAAARDATIVAVVLTHHHADHAAAAGWARTWQAPIHTGDPALVEVAAGRLEDGGHLARAGVEIEAIATPGHASDHLCLRVEETGAVLTGDHVLGRGTTVVAWPDGDMAAYLSSLERLAAVDATVLHPGHGPIVDRPAEAVAGYLAHRREREHQVHEAVGAGLGTLEAIVESVYCDVDPALHVVAQRSVRAHLDMLADEGRVRITRGADGKEHFDAG